MLLEMVMTLLLKILLALLLSTECFSIPLPISSTNHTNHWIFIHYHKTGHDLARRLAQTFQTWPCSALVFHSFLRRVPLQNQLRLLHGTDVAVVAAPDVQIAWNSSFLNQTNSTLKMVHFVRDPYEMILSAYLYHSQLSPPGKEAWLKHSTFNPCEVASKQLNIFSNYVGKIYGNVLHFRTLILLTTSICEDIYTKVPALGARGYSAALRGLSKEDGIILEATRSIVNMRGGDILRMATNALFERNTSGNQTYRVFLPEFPVGNLTQFAQSSHKLFSYLMATSHPHDDYFWNCLDVPSAVQRSLELAFISESGTATAEKSTHVTKDMIPEYERVYLKQLLRTHHVLGPILNTVQNIVLM